MKRFLSRETLRARLPLVLAALVVTAGLAHRAAGQDAGAQQDDAAFQPIFDGKSLDGWDGDPRFWRVEEGTIVGQTTAENPTQGNTFLIWRKGKPANFELELEYRLEGGNSGVQYRSREVGDWVIAGYQADIDATNRFTGILYEEKGRGILVNRCTKVEITEDGEKKVLGKTTSEEDLLASVKSEGWNRYRIVARGNHIVQELNGHVTVDLVDRETGKAADSGLLAFQVHAGPPMKIQFRNIRLKELPQAADHTPQSASQSASPSPAKKIVFMAGRASHGYGAHEHYAGCLLLAKSLQQALGDRVRVEVFQNGWPRDPAALDGADALVMYSDGGGGHPVLPHLEQVQELADRGAGIVCLHYAVEVPRGEPGNRFLNWIGGYFETHWSVNPHWTAQFDSLPEHPITRGVQPFEVHDEWYYHMRFPENMEHVTPVLTATPPESTLRRPDGSHSGNPHVRAKAGQPQHVAWAIERPTGGRGFGFTGGHVHWNWGDPNFRKLVLNAIVWSAGMEVPTQGISDKPLTLEQLESNQDFPPPQNFDREQLRKQLKLPADVTLRSAPAATATVAVATAALARTAAPESPRDPSQAVTNLDVAEGLQAQLFASEPELLSLTNLDIDARGRVWVCEVVNYRGHNGERPEGDRILILEDTDGDGRSDKTTVYYQGRDVDSAMGICVLGNRVIVSCSPNILVFTDTDGDDQPDSKEVFFTNTGQPQHDHSAHTLLFGPDGKLYWNFGNTGKAVHDREGKPVVDVDGNQVVDNGKPYWGGMVFRMNPDGSQFEVLGHNFRNNYEVTVDSFGTLWQSDNDDDGNRGVRINYVMEFGNYGYLDELTGAGWKTERTGMHAEIPLRHWHLNDPGVVPNLLQTGAGSPTGITVYEGQLLPEVFRNEVIHCDAGPNVVRAYPVKPDGAGYKAEMVNILHGARDNWFRPADVCVAPDGSLFVTDWYDPGVGGHNMQDMQRGRLFRIAPPGQKYEVPTFDFTTTEGAIAALKNPNYAVRYLAWTALHEKGAAAEEALRKLFEDDNPRYRARALWLLGKIPGKGEQYVRLALSDDNPDIRIVGIRLARQLDLNIPEVAKSVLRDPSPQVRREVAIALRRCKSSEVPQLWAELASQYEGNDRWYLEALGIAAHNRWDACLEAWMAKVGDQWNSPAGRDIIWRSRGKKTPQYLVQLIRQAQDSQAEQDRYFRAFDFLQGPEKDQALQELLLQGS